MLYIHSLANKPITDSEKSLLVLEEKKYLQRNSIEMDVSMHICQEFANMFGICVFRQSSCSLLIKEYFQY